MQSSPSSQFSFSTFDVLHLIVEYVGPYQYIFVARINRGFHEAHSKVFSDDSTTHINASTIALAKICFDELVDTRYYYVVKSQHLLCSSAAKYGNLPALQYLRSVGCEWNWRTCINAALYGHFDILKWARENGCKWDEDTCAYAAENGHLHILQYVRKNRCPWDENTCSQAAKNGHLRVLQWAEANGCPWDKSTCTNAALNGHLHVLQWARENGCPWDK